MDEDKSKALVRYEPPSDPYNSAMVRYDPQRDPNRAANFHLYDDLLPFQDSQCLPIHENRLQLFKRPTLQTPDELLQISKLKPNTDLNITPSKWLYGSSKLDAYIRRLAVGKDSPLPSLQLAHRVCDFLPPEVDLISDAVNVKQILKMPFSRQQVSLMLHRVGNCLLLDEFDVHQHLLREHNDMWDWLVHFYRENVLTDMNGKPLLKKNRTLCNLQDKHLFSKFLYLSLRETHFLQLIDHLRYYPEEFRRASANMNFEGNFPCPTKLDTSCVKQASYAEICQEADGASCTEQDTNAFIIDDQRLVYWTFDDINMLLGTRLPVFGCGSHPCVSLKLRDMKKPINVLTGLEYWLDNLMCNVPELAMCYHVNGIVQHYELLRTEDIPSLDGSQFSPQVIKDFASNIISFLKANCTKEGHTYWLIKGPDDDIVKLYDLTDLCTEVQTNPERNPFALPVALLLYRVSRKMWIEGERKMDQLKAMLESSLAILTSEHIQNEYPQVAATVSYLLSDLYLSEADEIEVEARITALVRKVLVGEHRPGVVTIDMQTLCNAKVPPHRPPAIPPLTMYERCMRAAQIVSDALITLDDHIKFEMMSGSPTSLGDPRFTIPRGVSGYRPDCTFVEAELADPIPWCSRIPTNSWYAISKMLLMRKGARIACFQALQSQSDGNLGRALKYVHVSLYCHGTVASISPCHVDRTAVCSSLELACELQVQLAGRVDSDHHQEFLNLTDMSVLMIYESALLDLNPGLSRRLLPYGQWCQTLSDRIALAIKGFHMLLRIVCDKEAIERTKSHLAAAFSLAGTMVIDKCLEDLRELKDKDAFLEKWESIYQMVEHYLGCSVEYFTQIKDPVNSGLVQANWARAYRVYAAAFSAHDLSVELLPVLCINYNKLFHEAIKRYKHALTVLPQTIPEMLKSLHWEISSTYFTQASLLQDNVLKDAPQSERERILTELLSCALQYTETHHVAGRYRAATIHHRLAALFQKSLRFTTVSVERCKHLIQLSENHYAHALELYQEKPCEKWRVMVERCSLVEELGRNGVSQQWYTALNHLLSTQQYILEVKQMLPDETFLQTYGNEVKCLLDCTCNHLREVLKNLCSLKKDGCKGACYKEMYGLALHTDCTNTTVELHCTAMVELLKGVHTIWPKSHRSLSH